MSNQAVPARPDPAAQRVMEGLLRLPNGRFTGEIAFRLLRRRRHALIRNGDPLVTFRVGAADLLLPLSHELPYTLRRSPQYSQNIGRVAAAVQAKYQNPITLDIGSNVGDTVAILRQHTQAPILSVEGHPRFAVLWRQNAARNPAVFAGAVLAETLIGPEDRVVQGEMVSAKGTAHIAIADQQGAGHSLTLTSLEALLNTYPDFAAAKLIKIDTDGMDAQIITGNIGLIGRLKAAVFFEFSPPAGPIAASDHFHALIALKEVGYRTLLVWEELGEYAYSVDLADLARVEELCAFYAGRTDKRYADVCALHADDSDVAAALRTSELRLRAERNAP
jgi:FkbM family methyltransferase